MITQAPTAEADGVRTFTCEACGGTKTEAVKYLALTFGQTSQISLIEPWGLLANIRVRDGAKKNFTAEQMAALDSWGVYFVRESDLNKVDATQDNTSIEEIVNNANVVHMSKGNGVVQNPNGNEANMLQARFDKEIYTYDLGDSVYVLYYVVYDGYTYYAPLRERNLSQMVKDGITETAGTYNSYEKAIFSVMSKLEEDIIKYRADSTITPEIMDAPTLGESGLTGNIQDISAIGKSFGHTMNISLLEPWG